MYHPLAAGDEFIELQNATAADAPLYDPANPANTWKFLGGITFAFPQGVTIPGQGVALVVPIDPATFRSKYSIPPTVAIYGPYLATDPLDNAGDDIKLARPGAPQGLIVPYVLADKVKYTPASPWPADTAGNTLERRSPLLYGNDATNWKAGPVGGTPGIITVPQVAPIISAGTDAVVAQGQNLIRDGVFSDPNAEQTWTATINYGDGGGTVALPLDPDKTFHLNHPYANPGTFTLTIKVTDSLGGIATASFVVSVTPSTRQGTIAPDRFLVRLDPGGTMVQFFENNFTPTPNFSVALAVLPLVTFSGGANYDLLTIDMINGNPIPAAGIRFNGGSQDSPGDLINIVNPTSALTVELGATQMLVGGRPVTFSSLEGVRFDGGPGDDILRITEPSMFLPVLNGGGGNDTLRISAGNYSPNLDLGGQLENLTIDGSGAMTFNATQHLKLLSMADTATAAMAAGGVLVLQTQSLNITGSATLDLADNSLIVQSNTAGRAAALQAVTALAATGRNAGAWTGTGLTSSAAAFDATHLTGVAVISNAADDGSPIRTTFAEETVDADSILARRTWNGDTDLTGVVDATDYFHTDSGFAHGAAGFAHGDFDYTGKVDANDYFLIDKAFAAQSGVLGSAAKVAAKQSTIHPPTKHRHHRPPGSQATLRWS
jgi:hypothetical protein